MKRAKFLIVDEQLSLKLLRVYTIYLKWQYYLATDTINTNDNVFTSSQLIPTTVANIRERTDQPHASHRYRLFACPFDTSIVLLFMQSNDKPVMP